MKEQEMKRLIEENIPETPEAFHDRMNQTLNSIVVQERCQRMLETKNVPVRRARRRRLVWCWWRRWLWRPSIGTCSTICSEIRLKTRIR